MTASPQSGPPPLLLPSVANFRDLGGLQTVSGRQVAPRRLYRSNHFGGLAADDAPALAALGLRTVVDLRGAQERETAPGPAWAATVAHLHLPIEPRALGALRELRQAGEVDERAVLEVMHEAYRRYVREQSAVFGPLLHRLLDADSLPLVFHCTAGKDRTGFAAALVLSALGVAPERIVQDFLLSNGRWQPRQAARDWTLLAQVQPDYLETAFRTMREEWGSVEAYLDRALGFDAGAREQLAARLLV